MRRFRSVLPALVVLAMSGGHPDAAETSPARRSMTFDDLWAMQQVGKPVLSPDGRQVAFGVTVHSLDTNKGNSDLYLVPADGSAAPKRLTWNDGSDGSPTFSPDGRRLAFVSKRGTDEQAQLYVLPLDGGEADRVTNLPVAVENPKWLPDGKRIAFVATTWADLNDDFQAVRRRLEERDKDKVKAEITENRLLRYWNRYLTDGRVPHVFVVDLATREVKDLLPRSARWMKLQDGSGDFDISPDGAEIAFEAIATDPPYRRLQSDIFVVPVAGGAPRSVTADNLADDVAPRYSPDGRYLVYGRNVRPELDADFVRLVRRDRETGATVTLVEGLAGAPEEWSFSADGSSVLFHAQESGRVHLYAIPTSGGRPKVLVRGKTTGGAAAGAAGRIVCTIQSLTEPPELMSVREDGTEARALTSFNAARLAAIEPPRVEDIVFDGARGEPVQMFVLLPPGFDPGRKWPLVHMIHGGPHGAWLDSFHLRWNAALAASRGYVVALVNFHGSTGFGQPFAESIVGAHGDKPFTDIMNATDHLLARGYVDEKRMAAAGGSFGGYLVCWILGHTGRFAALIDHAGVFDLMAQYASDATWGRSTNYGAAPWEDPSRIDRYSPSRYAARFDTPTLILHGEKDYRVPVSQGINLHGVLAAKGVPSRIVIFPEEGHGIVKPAASRIWWSEVFAWLERYLGTPAAAVDRANP
jgi:dipeptidyl aminopeptidase/acylaminoacyl peptidase